MREKEKEERLVLRLGSNEAVKEDLQLRSGLKLRPLSLSFSRSATPSAIQRRICRWLNVSLAVSRGSPTRFSVSHFTGF